MPHFLSPTKPTRSLLFLCPATTALFSRAFFLCRRGYRLAPFNCLKQRQISHIALRRFPDFQSHATSEEPFRHAHAAYVNKKRVAVSTVTNQQANVQCKTEVSSIPSHTSQDTQNCQSLSPLHTVFEVLQQGSRRNTYVTLHYKKRKPREEGSRGGGLG